jgi:hypothetical protein
MNLRRGLFRLWIVGSALFVLGVAFVGYSEIKKQFDATALQRWVEANDALLVPQNCGQARGVAGTDYSTQQEGYPGDPYAKPCWYEIAKFRPLYPEYKNLSDRELSRKLYADHGIPTRDLPTPWATLGTWAAIAFGIPLAVLAFGASLLWGMSGFAAERRQP